MDVFHLKQTLTCVSQGDHLSYWIRNGYCEAVIHIQTASHWQHCTITIMNELCSQLQFGDKHQLLNEWNRIFTLQRPLIQLMWYKLKVKHLYGSFKIEPTFQRYCQENTFITRAKVDDTASIKEIYDNRQLKNHILWTVTCANSDDIWYFTAAE